MPDPNQIATVVEGVAEGLVPALAPFHPLIALVTTAVIAHFRATGTFPTEEEVRAAIPADWQRLQDVWANWRPSGDGTLQTTYASHSPASTSYTR